MIFGGIGQKPCAESDFAHAPGGALAFVWAGPQKEQSARLMEPTGLDGLWEKENERASPIFFLM